MLLPVLLAAAVPASANIGSGDVEGEPSTPTDIVVTAEHRQSRLQDTPIAISTFDAQQLRDQNASTVRDLAGRVPNLNIPRTYLTQSSQSFFLRGLGENDPSGDPAVGVYLDDVYVPRLFGVLTDFGDAERVEVLRGPQGTLYGRNTSGGAVRIITRDPGNDVTGRLSIGAGDRGQVEARAFVSGPLVEDRLFASVAASHRRHDGFTRNPTLGRRVNDLDITAFRAKLRFTPNDRLDLQLTGDNSFDYSTSMPRIPKNQPGGYNPGVTYGEFEPAGHVKAGGVSLRAIYELSDALSLKSITSWRYFRQTPMPQDGDGEAAAKATNVNSYDQKAWTQEFQLTGDYGAVSFVAGAFLFHEDFVALRHAYTRIDLGRLPRLQDSDITTDSIALFGQTTVKLSDRLSAAAGLRYTYDRRKSDFTLFQDNAQGVPVSTIFDADGKKGWNSLTPKVGLNFQASRDVLLYASYARGFKAGGFDRAASTAINAATAYDPEKVSSYEVGLKASVAGGLLVTNIAGFYTDIKGLQSSVFVVSDGSSRRGNAGNAEAYGVEVEATLQPVRWLTWRNALGYIHSRYLDFRDATGPGGVDATGNVFFFTPEWSVNSELTIEPKLDIPGQVRLIGSVQYQSSSYADVLNTPESKLPKQTFANAAIVYDTQDARWSFTLSAKNIFNKREPQFASYSAGSALDHVSNSDPRTLLATIAYSF